MPLTTQGKILRVLTDQSYHPGRRPAAGQGRRAGALGDLAQPRRGDRRRPLPRGSLSTGSTSSRCICRRCASGARTFPSWSTISSPASPPSGGMPTPDHVARRRWPRSRPTTGRATSASCATSSSGRSSSRRATGSAASRSTCCRPKSSTTQAQLGGSSAASMAIMGSAAARGARNVRARISARSRSAASPATSRAPRSFIGMERSALHRKLKALGIGDKRDEEE